MSAKQEIIDHYIDQDGLVTVDRDPGKWTTGNGLMHLGLFTALLSVTNQLSYSDACDIDEALEGCMKAPGIYNRNPGRPDLIAHDDLIGVATASLLTGNGSRADDILKYGLKHFLFWNNTDSFTINAFRGRSISFMLFLLGMSKSLLSFVFKPFSWLWFETSEPSDYHVMLDFMMTVGMAKRFRIFKSMAARKAKDPALVASVSDYFGIDHPLVDLAKQAAAY